MKIFKMYGANFCTENIKKDGNRLRFSHPTGYFNCIKIIMDSSVLGGEGGISIIILQTPTTHLQPPKSKYNTTGRA